MNKALKIAVILSAVDNMSSVVKSAFGNLQSELLKGGALVAGGIGLGQSLVDFTESFQNMEDAAAKAKISMMGPGGVLDPKVLAEITNFSANLSEEYGNTTANYLDMVRVMRNNRLTEEDIMGGAGKAAAQFGELFNILPKESALFAARMKNDMQVAVRDMPLMLDLAARLHGAGVGTTGYETIHELTEFYGKAGLGAINLGVSGLEDTKKLGALGGVFMSKGLTGQTVGTNFRRIFDGLRDAERLGKVTSTALGNGVELEFFKGGKFAGIENFTNQLAKLEGLDAQQIDAVLKPFSGKQGLSTDFLNYLVKFGGKDIAEYNKRLDEQANLQEKVAVSLDTLSMFILRAQRTWENARAAIVASGFGEALKDVFKLSKAVAEATITFAHSYPKIAKWTTYAIGMASVMLVLVGVFKMFAATMAFLKVPAIFTAITGAITGLEVALMSSGIGETLLVIAGAAMLIQSISDSMNSKPIFTKDGKVDKTKMGFFEEFLFDMKGTVPDTFKSKPAPNKNSNDSTIVNTFSPNITIQGNANKEVITEVMADAQKEFQKMMAQTINDRKRKMFADYGEDGKYHLQGGGGGAW